MALSDASKIIATEGAIGVPIILGLLNPVLSAKTKSVNALSV